MSELREIDNFVHGDGRPRSGADAGSTACRWAYSGEWEDAWWTTCGEGFTFTTGGPAENGFEFCPYCGQPIESKP